MAVTHAAATQNNIADTVLADIDAGTAGALKLYTAADAEVADLTLADPAGTVSGAVLTFDCSPALEDSAPTGSASPVTNAKIMTSAAANVLLCSVGTSGADINFAGGVTFSSGDTVQITSLTYTAPD